MDLTRCMSDKDIYVSTPKVSFRMKAGVVYELNKERADASFLFGAKPATAGVEPQSLPDPEAIKRDIRDAIQTLLNDGTSMGVTGTPRITDIRKIVPEATVQLRDEVWASFFNAE